MGEREIGSARAIRTYGSSRLDEHPAERRHSHTLLIAFLSVVGFIVLVAAAALASYQIVYGQRIPLGIQILDMDIGGLDEAGAKQLLSDNLGAYVRTPLSLRYQGRELKAPPGELGASFNVDGSVAQAFKLGQQGGIIEKVQNQASYLQQPQRLSLISVFNDVAFQGGVARLARELEQQPQDATIKLVGTEVVLTPSRPGYQIDRATLQKRLAESFATLSSARIDVPVLPVPPRVREDELAPAQKQMEGMLAGAVTVKYGNKKWTLDRAALAAMVSFQQTKDASGKLKAQAVLATDKAEAWAKGIAKDVEQEPQEIRLAWNGGKLAVTSPGRPGLSVDAVKFGAALNVTLGKADRTIDLPVAAVQPPGAGDPSTLGIKERIAQSSTNYSGSIPERAHNIALGSRRVNGKIVPPGGVFSMNDTVGDVSENSGYQLGFAIVGQDTVPDFGGGICQVVTTVFKAAFAAGFPVVERTNHLYVIDHYIPVLGVEATIYQPGVDMKFKNDTDKYILIEAGADGNNVYVNIYGTRPDREVVIEQPIISNVVRTDPTLIRQQSAALPKGTQVMTEAAQDGMDVTVYRSIKAGGKEVRRDRISSHYRPAHNVILEGTREVAEPNKQ